MSLIVCDNYFILHFWLYTVHVDDYHAHRRSTSFDWRQQPRRYTRYFRSLSFQDSAPSPDIGFSRGKAASMSAEAQEDDTGVFEGA